MFLKRVAAPAMLGFGLVLVAIGSGGRHSVGNPAGGSGTGVQPEYVLLEAGTLPSPDGEHPVFRPADANSESARQAADLLEHSYAWQALVLHQYVKNLLAHQPDADPTVASEPTYFVLGGTGGYADLGFWLEGDQGELIDKRTTSYVWGLSVSAGHWGDFEQLFPHELGHAMLAELSGWQQGVLASQIHQTTMVTDYWYALNEGWAEHFQAVAVDHTANGDLRALRGNPLLVGEQGPYGRLVRELEGRCVVCLTNASLPLWHNQREQHLRYAGVKANIFARQAAIPEMLLLSDDRQAALTYQALIPPDDTGVFRNGPQMLSSEGLISALFYRLVNDPHLQQTYREPAFYELFLPPGREVDWSQTSPQELFSPMDNVYLKLLRVFARHVRFDGNPVDESPMILVLKGYAADYPDEAEWLYGVFLEITKGITVEPRALQMAQSWAQGRVEAAEHQAYLSDLHRRLMSGQIAIDSAVGPQIWLRNARLQVGAWALDAYASILPRPYNFNLNAATAADLRTVPGVDARLAHEILRVRDERGGFSTLDDLASVHGMTPETLDRLRGMHQSMSAWIDRGDYRSAAEDELQVETALWVLAKRLLLQLATVLATGGLLFALLAFLRRATAKYLDLGGMVVSGESVGGRARRAIRRVGRVFGAVSAAFMAVVLPVTAFFVLQFLLILNDSHAHGFLIVLVFALAAWSLVALPRLGWHLVRRRQHRRTALYRAAWDLLTYILMFGTVGWLMCA